MEGETGDEETEALFISYAGDGKALGSVPLQLYAS